MDLGIVPRLAAELETSADSTGASIVLVPHIGNLDGTPSEDVLFGAGACRRADELRLAPLPSVRDAVWATAGTPTSW